MTLAEASRLVLRHQQDQEIITGRFKRQVLKYTFKYRWELCKITSNLNSAALRLNNRATVSTVLGSIAEESSYFHVFGWFLTRSRFLQLLELFLLESNRVRGPVCKVYALPAALIQRF